MEKSNQPKQSKKPKKNKNIGSEWRATDFIEQFKNESDRASVILVASILDEGLRKLLLSFFVPLPNSQDSLFDNATSPLANFSSKIDLAYRIGLISRKLARDLHIVRKIRNTFAHDIYNCDFTNGAVKSRVDEIAKSMKVWTERIHDVERDDKLLEGTKGVFIFTSVALISTLFQLAKSKEELKEAHEEWLYQREQEGEDTLKP